MQLVKYVHGLSELNKVSHLVEVGAVFSVDCSELRRSRIPPPSPFVLLLSSCSLDFSGLGKNRYLTPGSSQGRSPSYRLHFSSQHTLRKQDKKHTDRQGLERLCINGKNLSTFQISRSKWACVLCDVCVFDICERECPVNSVQQNLLRCRAVLRNQIMKYYPSIFHFVRVQMTQAIRF